MPGEIWQFRFTGFCASFRAVGRAASSDEGKPENDLARRVPPLKVPGCKGAGLRLSSGR